MTGIDHDTMAITATMTSSFHQMVYLYGIQVLVGVTLVAITIYRKEMSCNRCYSSAQEPPQKRTVRSASSSSSSSTMLQLDLDDMKTESLLEEAGCYGSGTYTLFLNTLRFLRRLLFRHRSGSSNSIFYFYYCNHSFLLLHYHLWDSITLWWTVAAEERHLEDILDGADNWCVLGPHSQQLQQQPQPQQLLRASSMNSTNSQQRRTNSRHYDAATYNRSPNDTHNVIVFPTCTASQMLPNDVLVHIFSYCYPQDIIAFSSTNRNIYHTLLFQQQQQQNDTDRTRSHHQELSNRIWKSLWYRDYGWMVTYWDIGRQALQRSFSQRSNENGPGVGSLCGSDDWDDHIVYTPTFYFRFGMSYVNYIIAGQCNHHQCFIGLGGHIYDITKFIDRHPGSSETLLVHSGRDASSMFEMMRHTISARILAEQFCVVVDTSLLPGEVGARPTKHFLRLVGASLSSDDRRHLTPVLSPLVSHRCQTNRSVPATLEYVYTNFIEERTIYESQAKAILGSMSSDTVVGEVHVYYDPMIEEWKGWYMNTNFEAVFIEL